MEPPAEIFLATQPGLEPFLADEAREAGFAVAAVGQGGVTVGGGWPEVWRANLCLRGASRVLARIGSFRALHLAQLDKRARKFPWADVLRRDVAIRVEATCRKSRIYHAGAAAERVGRAIAETLGAPVRDDAALRLLVRIEDDLCTFSLDTSGEPLHRRGHKLAVGKAPLRETMAAMFLRACGHGGDGGGGGPVLDPMCGSGTIPIEAAEIAAGLLPGRARAFAFEALATFDAAAWQALRSASAPRPPAARFLGADRDAGAVRMAAGNAARAGVEGWTAFARHALSDLARPDGPPGLLLVNPPYGGRIGERRALFALYGSLGKVALDRFRGWRVGIVTSDDGLARATGLPGLAPGEPVEHGGLRVRLWQAGPLA